MDTIKVLKNVALFNNPLRDCPKFRAVLLRGLQQIGEFPIYGVNVGWSNWDLARHVIYCFTHNKANGVWGRRFALRICRFAKNRH